MGYFIHISDFNQKAEEMIVAGSLNEQSKDDIASDLDRIRNHYNEVMYLRAELSGENLSNPILSTIWLELSNVTRDLKNQVYSKIS